MENQQNPLAENQPKQKRKYVRKQKTNEDSTILQNNDDNEDKQRKPRSKRVQIGTCTHCANAFYSYINA